MREQTRREHERLLAEAEQLVAQNLGDRDLSLAALARELAVSPRQLQRVFATSAGVHFGAYLLRVRVERASGLLEDGMAARQVALRTGYGSGSALIKAMRRYHERDGDGTA